MSVIPKNIENTQFARTATEDGNRTTPLDPNIVGSDDGIDPLADGHGRLITRIALENGYVTNVNPFPVAVVQSATRLVQKSAQPVPTEGEIVFNVPIILYSITGLNFNITDFYIQLFNSINLPVNLTTVPDYVYYLPSGPGGLPKELMNDIIYPSAGFSNGLVLAFSTRPDIFEEPVSGPGFVYNISYNTI